MKKHYLSQESGVIRYILEVQNKELELGHWNYTGKNKVLHL